MIIIIILFYQLFSNLYLQRTDFVLVLHVSLVLDDDELRLWLSGLLENDKCYIYI